MLAHLQTHHIIGTLSVLQGLSFLLEQYQLVSRALATPLSLLDWVPGISGQHAWGICFLVGGLCILISWNIYLRAIALAGGALTWGFLAVGALYESLFGPNADKTGSYAGLLALTIVFAFLRASAQLSNDFRRPTNKNTAHN